MAKGPLRNVSLQIPRLKAGQGLFQGAKVRNEPWANPPSQNMTIQSVSLHVHNNSGTARLLAF